MIRKPEPMHYRTEYLRLKSALHDPATGLPAYPLLVNELQSRLDARRQIGVLHVGMSGLPLVESLYGWQTLDRILSRVAAGLTAMVGDVLPEGSMLSVNAVAGDRFIIFIPKIPGSLEVDAGQLATIGVTVAERLESQFDDDEFAGLNPRLGFQVGHALLSENPYYRFERRIHGSVEEARNREERLEQSRDRAGADELRRIIEDSDVTTLFHPIIDLFTGETLGHEALARGPRGSIYEMPVSMFAASGPAGETAALDRLCRTTALCSCCRMDGLGKLFINVTPQSLSDPEWQSGRIVDLLAEAALTPGDLVLELSEPDADQDTAKTAAAIAPLRSRGFGIALDDVGSGYASLATMERLCPDYLKVDGSLIRDIDSHLIKQEALTSLVQVAGRLGSAVIAEGVESEAESTAIRDLGVRFGQGFLFAAPGMPGEAAGN
ncbi:MAG: EAL domain-containing protein [Acidobacteria bacterium]|uniref:EAL domain-containing protein n=1 Tax=Candidatus Polarisedimenticola svalbardensis TaxID=2886004 RepID=A0A8J7CLL7_9BACT|nr:EAL domain-containing protein [Candidatus Polarisedimenticola svalbardensis]